MKTTEITKSMYLAEIETVYKTKQKVSEMPVLKSHEDTDKYLRSVWNMNKIEHVEEFIIVPLNRANRALGWVKISTGGITGLMADSRVIFQVALLANASQIILSHNHPSGNLKPSQEDINITKNLVRCGEILNIKVVDHIIISTEGFYSFANEGIL